MRLSIVFSSRTPRTPVILPLNYQSSLQGLIYKVMQDKSFSTFLHDTGFRSQNRIFRLFTFSQLSGKAIIDPKRKTIQFNDAFHLKISSAVPEFIQEFGRSLLLTEDIQLHEQPLQVDQLSYERLQVDKPRCRIRTLSPITVHSTFQTSDGKKITQFYDPDDTVFPYMIRENLRKKYEAFTGRKTGDEFMIRPVRVTPKDKVVAKYDGFWITAWRGIFDVVSTPELIRFALQTGLGARSAQGFGMVEIVPQPESNTQEQGGEMERADGMDDPDRTGGHEKSDVAEGENPSVDRRDQ